jgi:hypothetical protein
MSATSRRRFLSSAAAVAAAATAASVGCNPTPVPTNTSGNGAPGGGAPGGGTPAPPAPAMDADAQSAINFLRTPRFLDPGLDNKPSSGLLMYGLVCVDFGDKELLLPNTSGLPTGAEVHPHRARIWLVASEVQPGSDPADGSITVAARQFSYWDIGGQVVTIEAYSSAGVIVAPTATPLAWRDSPLHPWTNRKWVRCLKDLTNKDMILAANRSNTSLVTSRVTMGTGSVTAIPPSTDRGRLTQWRAQKHDGTYMQHATTDAMVWQRDYVTAVASYKITLADSTPRTINVKADARQSMFAAVTHAMPPGMLPNPNSLTDTRAFALLLQGGDPETHPTPQADRNGYASQSASGSDGHCECGCN